MSLDSSYRRLLACYPASWRALHGEELRGILLDAAEARHATQVSAADVCDLVAHGLAERGRATRRLLAPEDVLAWAAYFALASGAALAAVFEVRAEVIVGTVPPWARDPSRVGNVWTLAGYVYPLFVLACLAYAARQDRLAHALAGAGAVLMAAIVPASRLLGLDRPPLWVLAAFVALGALGAATRARGPRAGAIATAAVVAGAMFLRVGWRFTFTEPAGSPGGGGTYPASFLFYRFGGTWGLWTLLVQVTATAGIALLLAAFIRPRAWALGLLVAGLPWFALGVGPLAMQGMRGAANAPELASVVLAPVIAWVAINIEVRLHRSAGRRPPTAL